MKIIFQLKDNIENLNYNEIKKPHQQKLKEFQNIEEQYENCKNDTMEIINQYNIEEEEYSNDSNNNIDLNDIAYKENYIYQHDLFLPYYCSIYNPDLNNKKRNMD